MIEDPFAVTLATAAPGVLRAFNEAGVLAPADVHVARRLAAVGSERDEEVVLAAALAVRAPRVGDVHADLASVHETALPDAAEPAEPPAELPWPAYDRWIERVAGSPLVAIGEDDVAARPLRLVGSALYLDRYWRDERQIASDLRLGIGVGVERAELRDGLRRLFGDEGQRRAAATALTHLNSVIAGGPGTGKTTTVARIVALLLEEARLGARPAPLVALAAPTAKAAARLGEAIVDETGRMEVAPEIAERLRSLEALTLHRLLGRRRDSHSRFWHDRSNRLPYDVVVVDETSMVSLTLMARLLDAVRPETRLILVGDPGQLAAVEAGAVLRDIVGPVSVAPRVGPGAAASLSDVTGSEVAPTTGGATIGDSIVVLERGFRFGGGVADLADAVRRGDADTAVEVLRGDAEGVEWVDDEHLAPVREAAVAAARAVREAAEDGDAAAAIAALGGFRVLCAHRRGDHGVSAWTARIEGWLAERLDGFRGDVPWYTGRPLLMTRNDYGLRLFNGDTGVVVATPGGGTEAAFLRQGGVVGFHPSRLDAIETVYAMTVHKSQGSQFGTAAVVLPEPSSRLLSRELLYTAVTRAKERLIVTGSEEAVRAAVERPIVRASGLRGRLWT